MKVVIVSNFFPPFARGGYELGARDIAIALANSGHEVDVVTSSPLGSQIRPGGGPSGLRVHTVLMPIVVYDHFDVSDHTLWRNERRNAFGGYIPSNCVALYRLLESLRPDAVWCFNILGLGPVGILETALACCDNVTVHLMENVDSVIAEHQDDIALLGRFKSLKRVCKAISCSERIKKQNSRLGPYAVNTVIYNGVRFPPQYPERSFSDTRRPFKLIYFGQVEDHKGIIEVLEALMRLPSSCAVTLDIYGKGSATFAKRLDHKIRSLKLGQVVNIKGFVPKEWLMREAQRYDAAIMLAGPDEPFAYAQLEAVALGLPLITTAGGGFGECVGDDYRFLINDRSKPAEVCEKIALVASDRLQAKKVAERLFTKIAKLCDVEDVSFPAYLKCIGFGVKASAPKSSLQDILSVAYMSKFAFI